MRTISGGDGADPAVEPERAEPVDEVADQPQRDVGDDHRHRDRAVAERRRDQAEQVGQRVRRGGQRGAVVGAHPVRQFAPPDERVDRVVVGEADREDAAAGPPLTAATQAAGVSQLRDPRWHRRTVSAPPRRGRLAGAVDTLARAPMSRVDLPLPPPPPRLLRRGRRPAARGPHPAQRGRAGQGPPRLPLRRLARDRQDLDGEDPRPLAQLRARRADRDPLRRMRVLRDDRRRHLDRRDRDGRRLQPLGRRRPRPARAGRLRAGRRPLEGLHPRRGAHADQGGLERLPEDARGAAAEHRLRPRHDRVAQGDGDDRRPLPALRLPAALAGADLRGAEPGRRGRGDRGRRRAPWR